MNAVRIPAVFAVLASTMTFAAACYDFNGNTDDCIRQMRQDWEVDCVRSNTEKGLSTSSCFANLQNAIAWCKEECPKIR